jgi:hypothetical protein
MELAKILNCEIHIFEIEGVLRYPFSIIKTIYYLLKDKPEILFVQNPSMILAVFVCLIHKIAKTILIVDRHSTLFSENKSNNNLKLNFFLRIVLRNW